MNYQNLTALDMGIAASLILINGALSLLLRLGLGRQLLWAAVRTVVKLVVWLRWPSLRQAPAYTMLR